MNILVFNQLDKWHINLAPAIKTAFEKLSKEKKFECQISDNDSIFQNDLSKFDAIVFFHHACNLDKVSQENIKQYVQNGGGIVGIHSVSITKNSLIRWDWWEQMIGCVFLKHPPIQKATLIINDKEFQATKHLPESWELLDEWYEFETVLSKNLKVVLSVDESSYHPIKPMGEHPIAWYQLFDGGKIFYTAIGHKPEHYLNPLFIDHLYGGIIWAAT